jgi:hypothetical protein
MTNQSTNEEYPVNCATCEYIYRDNTCWITKKRIPLPDNRVCSEWKLAEDFSNKKNSVMMNSKYLN